MNDSDVEGNVWPVPDSHWVNKQLDEEDGKTLLMVAIDNQLHDFVDVLLQAGASAKLYNDELDAAPIHVAARKGDLKSLQLLFRNSRNRPDINSRCQDDRNRTALHMCADKGFRSCLAFLLSQEGIDVDIKDSSGGQTALYLAAKARSCEMVTDLLRRGAFKDHVCFGRTVRDHILENIPGLDPDAVAVETTTTSPTQDANSLQRVVDILSFDTKLASKYMEEFKSLLSGVDSAVLNRHDFGGQTLLQKLVGRGMHDHVEWLLKDGKVNPDVVIETMQIAPILLAAERGDVKTIQLLINHKATVTVTNASTRENILHCVLKHGSDPSRRKYEQCLEYLLDSQEVAGALRSIVNKRDELKNTPLHYATRFWSQQVVRRLLEVGANIGMKNHWSEVPISRIEPQTMEDFLDEFCIHSTGDINHENLEVTFNYSFLAPPPEDLPYAFNENSNAVDPESQMLNPADAPSKVALPETQSLWHFGESKEHRHLLKHPVITSFLYLKWGRIRKDFNRNLRFYVLFVFILTWFIFEKYGGRAIKSTGRTITLWHSMFWILSIIFLLFIMKDWIADIREKMKTEKMRENEDQEDIAPGKVWIVLLLANWIEVLFLVFIGFVCVRGDDTSTLSASLFALTALLIVRETFQALVSLKRYLFSPENWLEVAVIILVLIILLHSKASDDVNRHLAAVAIVLSWAELITLVGKHPKLTRYNIYVVMFYKVMGTFFFFLCWYAFFIVAFGLGFYIMLHKDGPQDPPPSKDDYIFFNSPWLSLVKTSTMFVGELEFSDIPIQLETSLTPLAYIFFLSFVFLIVVVLMNLLNGLAVSDTGLIQEKAEIVSYMTQVETISYTESILLGDPFNFLSNWPALRWLRELPSCSFCAHLYKNRGFQRLLKNFTGVTNLLLFYDILPNKTLTVRPNASGSSCTWLQVRRVVR